MKVLFYICAALIVIMSVAAYGVYSYDKVIAGTGKRRVRERTLLLLAALFGGVGAHIAMKLLRHKTQHKQFTIPVPAFMLLQLALLLFLGVKAFF